MIIDLRRLEKHGGRISSDEIVPFEDAFERDTAIRCHVEVEYRPSGSAYYLHGDVKGTFVTPCHLCLDEVVQEVSGGFDVVVRKGGLEGEQQDASGADEDYIVLSLNENEISLDDYIYESLIVNIPMQIVCKEDCRGLCPTCGINRNRESCTCTEEHDPRWDALRKLGDKPAE